MSGPLTPFAKNWRDAFRDMVLIVMSILIAFALEAWWAGTQLTERAEDVRLGLQAEFQANVESLAGASTRLEVGIAANSGMLDLFGPGTPTLSVDSLQILIGRNFGVDDGFRPGAGVSRTLTAEEMSGLLGDSVAVLLARWSPTIDRIRDLGQLLEGGSVVLTRHWASLGIPVSNFTPPYARVPESGFDADASNMLRDVETESLFSVRAVQLGKLGFEYATATEIAETLVDLLTEAG